MWRRFAGLGTARSFSIWSRAIFASSTQKSWRTCAKRQKESTASRRCANRANANSRHALTDPGPSRAGTKAAREKEALAEGEKYVRSVHRSGASESGRKRVDPGGREAGGSLAEDQQVGRRGVRLEMPAEKRRANSARLRGGRIRVLEQIAHHVRRAETIGRAGPMLEAVRTGAALPEIDQRKTTGRRALVLGLLGEISALLRRPPPVHQEAIGRRVIGPKHGHALKVVRLQGRAEHAHMAGVPLEAGRIVPVSIVRVRKAVAAVVAKAVRLARSGRQSERVGLLVSIGRELRVLEVADPIRAVHARIAQLSEMIGPGLIDHAEKAAVSRVAKVEEVRGVNPVRSGLNVIGLSAVQSNGPGHRARVAVSDRANPAQPAGGRAEFVQAAGDGQVLALLVLALVVLVRLVLDPADLVRVDLGRAASVLRALEGLGHGRVDLDRVGLDRADPGRAAAGARTSAGLDLWTGGKFVGDSMSTLRTRVQGKDQERKQD